MSGNDEIIGDGGQPIDNAITKNANNKTAVNVVSEVASQRANRQLENHNYAGRSYSELNLIVNHRDIALTLNDGTLIYSS